MGDLGADDIDGAFGLGSVGDNTVHKDFFNDFKVDDLDDTVV
jgi:hypothetical protein